MARDISQSTRDEIVATSSNIAFLTMLVIESTELASPLYFVQNNVDVTSSAYNGSQTYVAANFSSTLPNQEESTVQDSSITISGISRQVIEAVRSIGDPPTIRMFVVREDTPNTIELGPFIFKLRNVSYDKSQVTGSLLYEYTLRNNISTITINSRSFPGLF
jgi:hypothetical protein